MTVAVTVMSHSTMMLLMTVCSNGTKTKGFLLTKIVTLMQRNNMKKEKVRNEAFEENNIKDARIRMQMT